MIRTAIDVYALVFENELRVATTFSRHHTSRRMVIQATQPGADLTAPTARTRVACGASSYHGPASTCPAAASRSVRPQGLSRIPVRYPVPSPFLRYREER